MRIRHRTDEEITSSEDSDDEEAKKKKEERKKKTTSGGESKSAGKSAGPEGEATGNHEEKMDVDESSSGQGVIKETSQEVNEEKSAGKKDEEVTAMDVREDEEVRSKNAVRSSREEVGSKEEEEVRSKEKEEVKSKDEEVKSKPTAENPAANARGEATAGDAGTADDSDDETPQYLARLLSELITGVADPKGPYRPSAKSKSAEAAGEAEGGKKEGEGGGGGESSLSSEVKPGAEGGAEGETSSGASGGQRRTFAERYAGPEGTTVTISAAPAPPFGIPGLPPMEGPSLSIKNRGDGAEPEVTEREVN